LGTQTKTKQDKHIFYEAISQRIRRKMKLPGKLLSALLLLTFLAACNLPGVQVNTNISPQDQAATVVAMTLQAGGITTSPGSASTPFASPVPPKPTVKPTLSINTNNAQCRSGPGTNFKVVATYPSGTIVDLLAKDTADGFWIVKDPASADLCWVQVQDATPGGSFESLPEVTPQASTASVPARPGSINYTFNCDNATLTTSMKWSDSADNENGYRVYRLGTQIADLPANTTSFDENIPYDIGTSITYSIEAYNDSGPSAQRSITFHCP
jgi:hypothetical protein